MTTPTNQPPERTTVNSQAPVMVTGASGYVGSWIVRRLLEEGHTVVGTVRDPGKKSGLEHLHRLAAEHPGRLTLATADLLDDGSFDAPMQGCELVVHNASPFIIAGIKDPDRQLVQPALTGTRNVLSAVDRTPSVKRVVLTSSMVAIYGDAEEAERVPGGVFTEEQWNTTSSPEHQPYSYAKTVAEREAWRIQQAQERWDLVTLHPGLVLGPSLTTASASTSLTIMKQFADGTMLAGAPELYFGVVDVRDVADGHVRAGFTPEAKGRYLITADTLSFPEIGRILRRRFGELYAFPRTTVPKFLYRAIAPALGYTRTFVDRNVGYPVAFDSSRSRAELSLSYRPLEDTIAEHFQQMLDDRVVKRILFPPKQEPDAMQTVHVTQDFPQPVEQVFEYLAEHENLAPVFGAKVRRLNDGTDGSRNGVGSAREMRVGPLPPWVETDLEVVPNELIRYAITKGGILKDHEGVLRFTSRGGGSHLDWTITFDGKVPGIGPVVKTKLTRDVSRAMRKLAATGSA